MAMYVGKINPIQFKGLSKTLQTSPQEEPRIQTSELVSPAPDYAVKVPQQYSFLGMREFSNGLQAYSYKLANGHQVTIVPMEDSPTVVKNYVNVGSMNETDDIKGISHFLEHMAFNGTNGSDSYIKLEQGDSFKKIDALGGWANASTNYAVTDYVNSTPQLEEKDLEKQLQIIAAMTEDLSLADKMIEKEKAPVSSEINMILDNPQTILMDQTVRTLFNVKSSSDELIGGSVKHIQNLDREKVKKYYDTYYTPDNMNLVITGNVDPQKTIEMVSKLFKSTKIRQGKRYEESMIPIKSTVRKDFITDKASSTEIMLGFAGPKNCDTKAKIIENMISKFYIDSTKTKLSGELKKLNANSYMGMEKVSTNPNNPMFLYYGLASSEANSEKALKAVYDVLSDLKAPQEEALNNMKEKLLQDYRRDMEYSSTVNDEIGNAVLNNEVDKLANYEDIVNSITPQDIQDFIDRYMDMDKVALTVIHPQTTTEEIIENHKKAAEVSFKARPMKTDKITTQKLDNNYELAIQKTKNSDIYFNLNLKYDFPIKNPAVGAVLNEIYQLNMEDDNLKSFQEDNNTLNDAYLDSSNFNLSGYSSSKNFVKNVRKTLDILNNPTINQDLLDRAVERIRDGIERSQYTAEGLYIDNEAKSNRLYTAKSDILEGLNAVTVEDVKDLHKEILQNASGTISANVPETQSELKDTIISEFSKFPKVKANNTELIKVYQNNTSSVVLTKDRSVSQADIMELFKFKLDNTPKERVLRDMLCTILTGSHTIGLFDILREKEHLAYTVFSSSDSVGDCGEFSLNILTTTDNKDIGEISYENLQKSIDGFNRQIKELLDSKYSDEDLESAKKNLKARLLEKEGTDNKMTALQIGLNSPEGVELENKMFDLIDSITREDVDEFAKKVFKNPPIYSVVASKDTLDANKNYLENLAS
jgi:predicted Zn-dependent peptidase